MARRSEDTTRPFLVVHGHFYQPPRENPWLDTIEHERSAQPFAHWNARITDECYRTNGWARVFDDRGRVVDAVNNYRHLSFNFGPTLLTWMEREEPRTYARLLEADRLSASERSGHGNALAQSYSHAILPLCSRRDRLTLIRWGRRDFEHRFGRRPEAMWLPETAIDAPTVEDLIDEGMGFVVLSPYQARRIRRLGDKEWTDVGGGKVDPRQPYRCLSAANPERHLDVFFYDGPVSHAVSFERVLDSSQRFVDRLWGAVEAGRSGPQLVHTAVDGETFGHHQRHAERALAYALTRLAPKRGFSLTNYAEYLERFPPTFEVELSFGPEGEGSAWSCAHGVGRWCRDCGCSAGAPPGWNQTWRAPLRKVVNMVRDEAARLLQEMGGDLLADPWAARDDYVEVLLDSTPSGRAAFLARHGKDGQGLARQVRIFKLLEMQRHSLMAQTSCGWFFNDISGLEAVQVLRYTARTVQLIEELSGRNVEQRALEVLAEARSNLPAEGTGADIYLNRVLLSSVDMRRFVAQFAITDMFKDHPDDCVLYGHKVRRLEQRRLQSGNLTFTVGRVEVESLRTTEDSDLSYVLIHFGGHDFHCAVRSFPGIQDFRTMTRKLEAIFGQATITELLRAVDAHFGTTYYGLPQLLPEEREDVLDSLFADMIEHFAELYTRLYMDYRRTVNALIDSGLKVSREFRMAAEYTLSRQLNEEIRNQRCSRDPDRYRRAQEIVREAVHGGYELDLSESEALFGQMLSESILTLVQQPSRQACQETLDLFTLTSSLNIRLPMDEPQERLLEMIFAERGRAPWAGIEVDLAALLEGMHISPVILSGVPELGREPPAQGGELPPREAEPPAEGEAPPEEIPGQILLPNGGEGHAPAGPQGSGN